MTPPPQWSLSSDGARTTTMGRGHEAAVGGETSRLSLDVERDLAKTLD